MWREPLPKLLTRLAAWIKRAAKKTERLGINHCKKTLEAMGVDFALAPRTVSVLAGLAVGISNHKEKMKMKSEKRNMLTIVLFTVYMLLLTGIILFKLPFYSEKISDGIRVINLIPLQGSFDENGVILLREIIYNILLFIPFGVYVCILKSEWPFIKKVLPVIGLSLTFEVIQFIFAMGRTDVTDVLGNTLGGIIGIDIYALLFKIFKSRTVKIINILALLLTVCVVLRFAYLFFLSHFVMGRPSR